MPLLRVASWSSSSVSGPSVGGGGGAIMRRNVSVARHERRERRKIPAVARRQRIGERQRVAERGLDLRERLIELVRGRRRRHAQELRRTADIDGLAPRQRRRRG